MEVPPGKPVSLNLIIIHHPFQKQNEYHTLYLLSPKHNLVSVDTETISKKK